MPHQINVNVIVVIDVGAGRQHGRELLARRQLHVMQESLLFRRSSPAVLHADPVAVSQREFRNVERIAESMLGNVCVRVAIHTAAGIGGDLFDLDDRFAEPMHRGRLHGSRNPPIERGNNRAGERRRRLHFNRAARIDRPIHARGAERSAFVWRGWRGFDASRVGGCRRGINWRRIIRRSNTWRRQSHGRHTAPRARSALI